MSRKSYRSVFSSLSVTAIIFVSLLAWGSQAIATGPANDLSDALGQVERHGQFTFSSDVVQTEQFAPRLENVGRSDQVSRMTIDGSVDQPADLTTMTMQSADGQLHNAVKVEQGIVYKKQGDGAWQRSDQSLDLIAPNGSPLTFLDLAKNFEYVSQSALIPDGMVPDSAEITRIRFDIDRAQFTQQIRERIINELEAKNQYRAGMGFDLESTYGQMTGVGELWLSADGLPLRQVLDITLPQADGNTITARIDTNFSDWAATDAPPFALPQIEVSIEQARAVSINLTLLVISAVGATFLVVFSRSRRLYAVFAVTLTFAMVVTPLLQLVQAADLHAFANTVEALHAAEPENADEQPTQTERAFNPSVDPLLNQAAADAVQVANPAATRAVTNFTTGADTDGDGLTDDVEIYKLGTNPNAKDTDGDSISDGVEVAGFQINGKTWYLNPLSVDSNRDGLTDNLECLERVNIDINGAFFSGITPAACIDTDGDHVPDVFDYDNDNDGVPDNVDSSPNYTGGGKTQTESGFKYNLSGLTLHKSYEVHLQIRPNNDSHFYLKDNVFDWPSNDTAGQIQRVKTDTLSNHGVGGDAARNGDIMVSPELEITIPWNPADPTRGLPISSTITINKDTPLSAFVDTNVLFQSRTTARLDASTGAVQLLIGLNDVQDSVGDRIVAWSGQLPLLPKVAASSDHTVRLAWNVTGLLDTCDPAKAPAGADRSTYCSATNVSNWTTQRSLLHRYYAPFQFTGMRVVEDGGIDLAMIADDDAPTSTYPRDLWHLSEGLRENFVRPTTLANGSRFDVAEIVRRFADGSSATSTERWGIATNALAVTRLQYPNRMTGGADIIRTQTKAFLTTAFPSPADGAETTIAMVQESVSRTAVPNDNDTEIYSYDSASNKFSVNFSSAEKETIASLQWRPYKYTTANGWASQDSPGARVVALKTSVTPLLTNSVLDTLYTGTISNHTHSRESALSIVSAHYIAMYAGFTKPVQLESTLIAGRPLDDSKYQLGASDQPLFTVIGTAANALFSAVLANTVITIDGKTLSLTGFVPSANLAELYLYRKVSREKTKEIQRKIKAEI